MKNFTLDIDSLNFQKDNGLITAVIQDSNSGTVLMVGYQNREACEKTVQTGQVTFWSRTKKRLWTKGEESGNFLEIVDAKIDCDADTLLYSVKAPTSTCHTGKFCCFGDKSSFGFLFQLAQLIQDRKKNLPDGSYTTELFEEGLTRIAQKVGEEAVETVIAALAQEKEKFVSESADLMFHWLVLCVEKNVDFEEIIFELRQRNL